MRGVKETRRNVYSAKEVANMFFENEKKAFLEFAGKEVVIYGCVINHGCTMDGVEYLQLRTNSHLFLYLYLFQEQELVKVTHNKSYAFACSGIALDRNDIYALSCILVPDKVNWYQKKYYEL